MSWLFSQALVEEYLVDTSSDGEQSAPLNGNPTQQAYCVPDKMKVFSRLSRFGMTYKPLTEARGEELLTLFLADFPVRTYQQPEKAQGLTENDRECGAIWQGWLAKYDPDTSLWKTAQCSLTGDLTECLATLPRSGMTRGGLLWVLPKLERRTSATESGLWRTPSSSVVEPKSTVVKLTGRKPSDPQVGLADQVGGKLNPVWVEWLMGWPLGWTDLKPLGTDKFQQWQQQHGRR